MPTKIRPHAAAPPKDLAAELGKREPFASPEQEAFLNLARTYESLAGDFDRLFKEHGLSSPQFNALRILRGHAEPMQVYQIAERMVTPQTDITRLVDRLELAGFVKRERCGEDRRVVWVTLTAAGKSVLKKLDRPVNELHQQQFRHFNQRELHTLSQLLFKARHPD
jgi:MarR family transcriptional regulator, 2-MHQ and catechol-resistance regulon repressor